MVHTAPSLPTVVQRHKGAAFLCRASWFSTGGRATDAQRRITEAIAASGEPLVAVSSGALQARTVVVLGPHVEPEPPIWETVCRILDEGIEVQPPMHQLIALAGRCAIA